MFFFLNDKVTFSIELNRHLDFKNTKRAKEVNSIFLLSLSKYHF